MVCAAIQSGVDVNIKLPGKVRMYKLEWKSTIITIFIVVVVNSLHNYSEQV